MKILHAIDGMDPELGGVCQAVRLMIPSLFKQGVHNEVVSMDNPTAPFLAVESFVIHALGPGYGPWNYTSSLVPWLVENLPRFDAVIIHGLWQYHGYAVRTAMRQLKKAPPTLSKLPKVFVFPQGMLDPYFQRAPERKLKAIRNWAYWKMVEGRVINDADGVFFTCETERQLARQPFRPYRPQQEVVIGMGVGELAPYTPAMRQAFADACPMLGSNPYILFLSRIHEKKGVDLLIKAYANLLTANKEWAAEPSDGAASPPLPKLVIVGPGLETSYGQKMQQLASETLELQEAILFPGMLEGDAKWGAFYGCEAFILPSHQENFGIAVVEALVCSKPVLISDQINIWREIDGTGGGIVNKDTESGTLDSLIRWQALSADAKKATAKKARECYEEHFAIAPVTQRMISAVQA